ncbi:NPC intracellular cholesterol transporter 2-like [Sycon ciliatum]|uniref:NPC intracellular cholesterol transporter 2-like n=1 Tax=Sycon ciliatum TaxID=27933 RepID=UPI0020AD7793|eukprot:scpid91376/ scgid25938/ Epididymal secretory protein E1; 16.5 kDa secretory protein; Niemann Pick type C2 protein homolog
MKVQLLALAVGATLVIGAASLHVKTIPCKGDHVEAASVNFIDISPCTENPCALKRGSTYELTISLETGPEPAEIPKLTTHVDAIIHGIPIPWPGFNYTDACKDCGLSCPLSPNKAYSYAIPLNVISPIAIETVVKLRIEDDTTNVNLLCNELQVKVV